MDDGPPMFVLCCLHFAFVLLLKKRRGEHFAQPLLLAVSRLAIGFCASKRVLQQQSFQEMQELSALLVSVFWFTVPRLLAIPA